MANKSVQTPGDTWSVRDREALGRHSYLGLLKYRDFDAGYCNVCGEVYNVECPSCHTYSGKHGLISDILFRVGRPLETIRLENRVWTSVECAKCDFRFRVLVQPVKGHAIGYGVATN